jgi:hypothetical protein
MGVGGGGGGGGGWVRRVHAATGREYWANAALRKTQWKRPEGWTGGASSGSGASSGAERVWEARRAADGRPYYANVRTKKTSWSVPPAHLIMQRGGGLPLSARSNGGSSKSGGGDRSRGDRYDRRERDRSRKKKKKKVDPRDMSVKEARAEIERQKDKAKKAMGRVAELEEELDVPLDKRSPKLDFSGRSRAIGAGAPAGHSPASSFMAALAAAKIHRAHVQSPATNLFPHQMGVAGTPTPQLTDAGGLSMQQMMQRVRGGSPMTPASGSGGAAWATTPTIPPEGAPVKTPGTPDDLNHPTHAMHRLKVDALASQQKIAALAAGATEDEAHAHGEALKAKLNVAHLATITLNNVAVEAEHAAQSAAHACGRWLGEVSAAVASAIAKQAAARAAQLAADEADNLALSASDSAKAAAASAASSAELEHLEHDKQSHAIVLIRNATEPACAAAQNASEAAEGLALLANEAIDLARLHAQNRANWTRTEEQWRLDLDERCLKLLGKLPFEARYWLGAVDSTPPTPQSEWKQGLVWIAAASSEDDDQVGVVAWSQPIADRSDERDGLQGQYLTPTDYIEISNDIQVSSSGSSCVVTGEGVRFEFAPAKLSPTRSELYITAKECEDAVAVVRRGAEKAKAATETAELERMRSILRALDRNREDDDDGGVKPIDLVQLEGQPDVIDLLMGCAVGVPTDPTDRGDVFELYEELKDEIFLRDKTAADFAEPDKKDGARIAVATLAEICLAVQAMYPASSRQCKVKPDDGFITTSDFMDEQIATLGIDIPGQVLQDLFAEISDGADKITPEQFAAAQVVAAMCFAEKDPVWPDVQEDDGSSNSKMEKEGPCNVGGSGFLSKDYPAWAVLRAERLEFFYDRKGNPGAAVPESEGWDTADIVSMKIKKKGTAGKLQKKGKHRGEHIGAVMTQFIVQRSTPIKPGSKKRKKSTHLLSFEYNEHKAWEKLIMKFVKKRRAAAK